MARSGNGPGKPAHRFRKCPCGEVFDMHGPEEVFVHVPHITAAECASRVEHGPVSVVGDGTVQAAGLEATGDPI